jgi:predicted MFS family arabinose efflux permease
MSGNSELSPKYSRYVLFVLFIVYVFNFADRYILIVVQSDIKEELGLLDWQLGMLHGLVFALFYTVVGIPIARLADRKSRTSLMSIGLVLWSGLTAACGLAQNFVHLLLLRIGVGVGEATATPCSHSLISDYFPPEKRSKAIAVYTIGANVGMLLGMMAGGYIAQKYGWRAAFYIVGLPGVLVALLVKLTVREPPRGLADGTQGSVENLPLGDTLRYLFSLKSFRHLCIAGAIAALTGFGIMNWSPVFFERMHGMTKEQTGPTLGVAIGIVGGLSVFIGGFLADRLSRRSRKWPMRIAAIGMVAMLPFLVLFLMVPDKTWSIIGINLTFLVGLLYNAPTFATVQGLARPDMRALAVAIFLFVINLVGMGLGPLVVGAMSDLLEPRFGHESLRYSMMIISLGTLWAPIHYLLAARSLPGDLDRAKQK